MKTFPLRPISGGPLSDLSNLLPGQWAYEPKVNGWRALIHAPTLTVYNRHGELSSVADEFADALSLIWENTPIELEWLDCEMLGRRHPVDKGKIIVLDAVIEGSYLERREAINRGLGLPLNGAGDGNQLTFTCSFTEENTISPSKHSGTFNEAIMQHWNAMQGDNVFFKHDYYEGLVAKMVDSLYETQLISPSKTTPYWVKFRFDQHKTSKGFK